MLRAEPLFVSDGRRRRARTALAGRWPGGGAWPGCPGPLLNRVDLKVELLPVGRAELLSDRQLAEPSSVVTAKVVEARLRAARRLEGTH